MKDPNFPRFCALALDKCREHFQSMNVEIEEDGWIFKAWVEYDDEKGITYMENVTIEPVFAQKFVETYAN